MGCKKSIHPPWCLSCFSALNLDFWGLQRVKKIFKKETEITKVHMYWIEGWALTLPFQIHLNDIFINHSSVAFAVRLGSLSCWKVNLCPSLKSWANSNKLSSNIYPLSSAIHFALNPNQFQTRCIYTDIMWQIMWHWLLTVMERG